MSTKAYEEQESKLDTRHQLRTLAAALDIALTDTTPEPAGKGAFEQ